MTPFYITTPIYYVNDQPHIGHAYTSVACDFIARFNRLLGNDVRFLTGTDEHGQKVEKSAAKAGIAPQEFVDDVSVKFREMTDLMNISVDDFIRTTETRHKRAAQALWQKMQEAGHITLGAYSGWYAVRDEAYYQESELVNGKAPTGADVEWVEEPSYFFNLSAWGDKLLAFYEANPNFIQPESRRNEIISFVKGGLRDLSISRTTFNWGVPVPNDEAHVMYVWLDALTNYLSSLGYPDEEGNAWSFWPANVHMVGKDIIRFHAVYWPAFLMACDLPLPHQIFAHGWWTIEGEKMSKSTGNAIAPADLVNEFGLDQTRWFMLREVPFGNDGNFAREGLINRVNSELANTIGNLAQRSLSMIAKNTNGKVPMRDDAVFSNDLKSLCYNKLGAIVQLVESKKLHLALEEVLNIAVAGNAFVDKEAPWALKKTDPARMEAVLYVLAEMLRCISIYLQAIMPDAANALLTQLAIPENERNFVHLTPDFSLKSSTSLPVPSAVFPRVGG